MVIYESSSDIESDIVLFIIAVGKAFLGKVSMSGMNASVSMC